MNILWVTDPWSALDQSTDTTCRLIEECILSGCRCVSADCNSIQLHKGQVCAEAAELRSLEGGGLERDQISLEVINRFDRIVYRTDPPVDLHYTLPLQLLITGARQSRAGPSIITNPPAVLLGISEKTESMVLELLPESVVSSSWAVLRGFGEAHKKTVVKPLNKAQSIGVSVQLWDSKENIKRSYNALHRATLNWTIPIIQQVYLRQVEQGEVRLWFSKADLIAVARKVPASPDGIIDMDRGATLERYSLTPFERSAVSRIAAHLNELDIRLAAIDMIGGHVTDFNVTSPGLLREFEQLYQMNFAQAVVAHLKR